MSVCTRKSDGQIFVQWKEDGKTRRKYFGKGEGAKGEAVQYNAVVTRKTVTGHAGGPQFAQLVKEYLQAKRAAMPAESLKNLSYKLHGVILPAIGHLQVHNITPERLDRYVQARAASVKMTTIHRELSDVRAILNWAVKRRLILASPMIGFEMPTRDDAVILPVGHEEIQQIIAHSADHLKRAMLLSFFCGLRPGAVELLSMRYNQINWSAGSVTVISAKKGGIQRREVPIHQSLPLREWFEQDGCDPERHIITWNGKPIKRLKTAWNMAKKRAGVGGRRIPMYSLRHSFVTTLLHSGIDLKSIADISGHDERTMLKHYAHSMDAARKAAINTLPDLAPPK